jgi:hypothetical protein
MTKLLYCNKKKPRKTRLFFIITNIHVRYYILLYDDLLQVQGHDPHPGQHINIALTNATILTRPDKPIIQTKNNSIPGITLSNQAYPSAPYHAVSKLNEKSAVIGHVIIQTIFITG